MEDNIKIDLIEVGGRIDCIHLAKYRDNWRVLVNTVMNHRVPQNYGSFFIGLSNCWLVTKDSAP
jgi:hypothetical protein